jgi:glycosyltransferase involved in cell wall biosynthesis
LAQQLNPDQVQFLYRTGSKKETASEWQTALDQQQPDLVYVINTALPGVWVAPRWSQKTKRPYVLDTGDVIFQMARRSGIGAGWRLPFLWYLERFAQRRAAAVVVRGTRHREHLIQQGFKRVEILRDGYVEPPVIPSESIDALKRKLGLQDSFVVGLMGSTVFSPRLRICYGWDILEALVNLKDLPVRALIIGDGSGLSWLKQRAHQLKVENQVIFTGRIPYSEVHQYLRIMDVALSTQTNNLPGRVRTTGKLPEYMIAERFILASRVGEAELILPDPMLVDYEGEVDLAYPTRLALRLRELQANPEILDLRKSLPGIARNLCDYSKLSQQWMSLVQQLVEANTRK